MYSCIAVLPCYHCCAIAVVTAGLPFCPIEHLRERFDDASGDANIVRRNVSLAQGENCLTA